MLDDSDLDDATWALWLAPGWVWVLVALFFVVVVAYAVQVNKEDCAALHCRSGQSPKLLAHECLCVEHAE